MKYRICPVCDQKMKSAHYCSNCRAWVKHPWVREVDYYLNERHPSWEANCSYHSPGGSRSDVPDQNRPSAPGQSRSSAPSQGRTSAPGQSRSSAPSQSRPSASGQTRSSAPSQSWPSASGQSRTSPSGSGGTVVQNPGSGQYRSGTAGTSIGSHGGTGIQGTTAQKTSGARYTSAARNKTAQGGAYTHVAGGSYGAPQIPRASGDPKRWVVVAAVIFITLSVLIQIGSAFLKLSGHNSRKQPETYEYDVDMGEYNVWDEDDYWYEDMSDEEARAAGVACNGMNHFAVTGEEMETVLRAAMDTYGYDFDKVERWTENGKSSDEICWYESSAQISIRTENQEAMPYIEINCDTVTGQLHWLDMDLESQEDMIQFVRLALKTMEDKQQLDPDGDILELFETDLLPLMEKAESFDCILGDVEIYGARYGDVYSVSIWPLSQAEDAGGE